MRPQSSHPYQERDDFKEMKEKELHYEAQASIKPRERKPMNYHPDVEEMLKQRELFVIEVFELCFGFCAMPTELNNEDYVPDDKKRPSYSYSEALDRLKEFEQVHHNHSDEYMVKKEKQ